MRLLVDTDVQGSGGTEAKKRWSVDFANALNKWQRSQEGVVFARSAGDSGKGAGGTTGSLGSTGPPLSGRVF